MKLSTDNQKYLSGECFSNAYRLPLRSDGCCARIDAILDIVQGKKVIHFGCCDHIPLIKKKVAEHTWLQQRLEERCAQVIGFDIAADAIAYVKENGFSSNVYCCDILTDDVSQLLQGSYDYVVLGEILEHVNDPVKFLKEVREKLSAFCKGIIITVPNLGNAFVCQNGQWSEYINSDHRYWFSPYTISKVMVCAGITPVEVLLADYQGIHITIQKHLGIKKIMGLNPAKARTLIAIGDL